MYYVLGVEPTRSWVLTLGEKLTKRQAQAAIRWQGSGYTDGYWRVCTWSPEHRCFVDEQGNELRPDVGPYTQEAWDRFLSSLPQA